MDQKKHRQAVCEAVVDFMSDRTGTALEIAGAPDDTERNQKAVDLLVKAPSSSIVLEHTRIESFGEQIADDHRIEWLAELEHELEDQLPRPGRYQIVINAGAVKGVRQPHTVKTALLNWVVAKASALELGSPTTAPRHFVRERPTGVPFEVTLARWPDGDGDVAVWRFTPNDLPEKRADRIRVALMEKCPKLSRAKGDLHGRSVLVLESNDPALANHVDIADAFSAVLPNTPVNQPDDVYLVQTDIEPWRIFVLKEADKCYLNPAADCRPHPKGR